MYTIIEDSDFDGPCAAPPQDAIAQGMSTPLATLGLLLISVSIALGLFGIDSRKDPKGKVSCPIISNVQGDLSHW